MKFNVSVQYEFKPDVLVEAAYAGARGIRSVQRLNVNYARFEECAGREKQDSGSTFPIHQQCDRD